MQRSKQWKFAAVIIAGLQCTACQQKQEEPAQVGFEKIARAEQSGQVLRRVRLTVKRAEEIGIKTGRVREQNIAGKVRKIVPAAAVIHDQQGMTWMFKCPDSLVFVQERIGVEDFDGDLAILSAGPPAGTAVVTVGAVELFNDEFNNVREAQATATTAGNGGEEIAGGAVTMQEDRSLKVVHRARGATGFTASVVVVYTPEDQEYQKIITQVGGLKPGETKEVQLELIK